jgi:hypothetical protein
MSKTVSIPSSPRNKPTADHLRALDDLVHRDEAPQSARKAPKPPMKRLTFDIDAALHKRIRMTCLERGKDMAAELRRILVENFPP